MALPPVLHGLVITSDRSLTPVRITTLRLQPTFDGLVAVSCRLPVRPGILRDGWKGRSSCPRFGSAHPGPGIPGPGNPRPAVTASAGYCEALRAPWAAPSRG